MAWARSSLADRLMAKGGIQVHYSRHNRHYNAVKHTLIIFFQDRFYCFKNSDEVGTRAATHRFDGTYDGEYFQFHTKNFGHWRKIKPEPTSSTECKLELVTYPPAKKKIIRENGKVIAWIAVNEDRKGRKVILAKENYNSPYLNSINIMDEFLLNLQIEKALLGDNNENISKVD
jgi:hypothetical protein